MFHYFGYGSNLSLPSLRAKGVEPRESMPATLEGWALRFNVRHWFRHEGGMGNIQRTGRRGDRVLGLVHLCDDAHLAALDAVEAYGWRYDRIEVDVQTALGIVRARTYVGMADAIDNSCLPTRRYLNIILAGAAAAGLDPGYIRKLRAHPLAPAREYPPFEPPSVPSVPSAIFNSSTLASHPQYTAIASAVFDMSAARGDLSCLIPLFGGKDMTLFHIRRLDTSDGSETEEDVRSGRLSEPALRYINAYLHEYSAEFRYVGRYTRD
ncbi:MAG: gamma-glutamylcyclotransferase family protein [Gemmatimonadaceae bacterium]